MTNSTYGVIDVGSNSVRLLISKNGQTINKFATITRLSLGMTEGRTLNKDAIKRTIDALSFFKDKAEKEYKVDKLFVFATAGVRYAKNKADFLRAVYNELGITVDVISGEVEAEIGALGALNGVDGGFIDMGGKSTEIVQILGGKRVFTKSMEIGVVSLCDMFNQNVEDIKSYCEKFIRDNIDLDNISTTPFVAVGGTATTLASISLGLKEYDFKAVDNTLLSLDNISDTIKKLQLVPVLDRSNIYCIQKGREDVILSGAVFYKVIMEYFNISNMRVRDCDNLEGYLIKKVGKND